MSSNVSDLSEIATQMRIYAIGLRGENDLKVGPHMAAQMFEDAALAIDQHTATLSPPASPQGVERLREALGDAFRGHDRMDREALDRWRHIAGKGGHDMAGVNMTTLSRLIATIDALEAALSHPLSGDPI